MKQYKLKDIFAGLSSSDSLLFDSYLTTFYPDITGNESNFLTDYASGHGYFDAAFVHKYGERVIDLEATTIAGAITEIRGLFSGVCLLNIQNWARLYYALSLDYNPLYNVDGTTTYVHGATSETRSYGQDKSTLVFGATQDTIGAHTDTTTNYQVAMNSTAEKETGKSSVSVGAEIDSSLEHTDTNTRDARSDTVSALTYTDTETKQGNIGVTKSTDLLDSEMQLRAKSGFWDTVFKTLSNEGGLYYACDFV